MMLSNSFYARDARTVAKDLLGKYLVRRLPARAGVRGKAVAYKIVETEAYVGPHDKASHAHRGRTKRNEPMWGAPGHWYVYFTYGMHYLLNIVTGKNGYPSAVLIRAVETVASRKPKQRYSIILKNYRISGPGRLTKALKIDTKLNTKRASHASGLWVEDRGERTSPRKIKRLPRVGIAYAEEWRDKPLRYVLRTCLESRGTRSGTRRF